MILLIFLFFCQHFIVSSAEEKGNQNYEKFLSLLEKLDDKNFGKNELRESAKFAKKAKSASEKAEFTAIIARYHTELAQDPASALKTIESVLPSSTSSSKSSVSSLSPKSLPFDSPELAPCIIEAGRAFLFSGKDIEALEVAETAFQKFSAISKVLSAELSSDISLKAKLYEKSIDWLELALKILDSAKYEKSDDEKMLSIIEKRLKKKLETAQRLRDIAEYGEGFVHYRDAETARLTKKSPLEAIVLYEDLIRLYPDSVYSEAAKAYIIKCLFELESPNATKKAKETLANFAKLIDEKKALLRNSKNLDLPKPVLTEIETEITGLEESLKRMKGIPLGEKSAKLATEKADAFLSENEYGLYRGEILVLLAERAFWLELDPVSAEKAYIRAWKWLENVNKLEDKLKLFNVPDKAFAVSAPPSVESETDFWGNTKKKEIKPGMIINRRTCPWYLADLREQCLLPLGFLFFYKGNKEKAIECFNEVLKYDEETRRLENSNEWNNCRRLKWGAENGYLNAYPAELELYKDRQKFVILVADYYFCIMDFDKSANLAKRLLNGEFGKLDAKQDDYPKYLLASCSYWSKNRKEAFITCRELLDDNVWTFTKDRAAITAANISWQIPDPQIVTDGIEILFKLAGANRENPYVHRARLILGSRLLQLGAIDEAEKWLKKVPNGKDGNESGYYIVAQDYLKAIEEFRKKNHR